MGIGHSPKGPKRPRTSSSSSNGPVDVNDANKDDSSDPSTSVLYTVSMNNTKLLNELCKMFQYQFEENNVIKSELAELKESNARLLKEMERLTSPVAESSSDMILSTVKEVKKSLQDGLFKVTDSIANSPSVKKPQSYSAVAKGSSSVMFVKPKNQGQTSDQTKTETIDTKKFPIQAVRNISNGGIAIECNDKQTVHQLKADTESKLGANYEFSAPPAKCPKIKIIGIADDMDEGAILSALVEQNEAVFKDCPTPKIVQKFKTKKSTGIKLEVNGTLFNRLMSARRVMIGWGTCVVYESFDVTRCFKCCGYHHVAKNCNASITCSKCGSDHDYKDCKSETFKCVNCFKASKSVKVDIKTDHSALSLDCPFYLRKIELEKRRIDYESVNSDGT